MDRVTSVVSAAGVISVHDARGQIFPYTEENCDERMIAYTLTVPGVLMTGRLQESNHRF